VLIPKRSSGSAGASDLAQLADVTVSDLVDGQVLTYVAGGNTWENMNLPTPPQPSRIGSVISLDQIAKTVAVSFATGGYEAAAECSMAALPSVGQQVLVEYVDDGHAVVSGAVLQPFSPVSISGLVAWHDATDNGTINLDANGHLVSWLNKAGMGNYAAPVPGSGNPSIVATAQIGGRQVLNANNLQLPVVGSFSHYTYVLVADIGASASTPGNPALSGWDGNALITAGSSGVLGIYNGGRISLWSGNSLAGLPVHGGPQSIAARFSAIGGEASSLLRNGVSIASGNTGNMPINPSPSSPLIYNPVPGGLALGMNVGEIMIFNRQISDAEMASLEAYIAQKWSIS